MAEKKSRSCNWPYAFSKWYAKVTIQYRASNRFQAPDMDGDDAEEYDAMEFLRPFQINDLVRIDLLCSAMQNTIEEAFDRFHASEIELVISADDVLPIEVFKCFGHLAYSIVLSAVFPWMSICEWLQVFVVTKSKNYRWLGFSGSQDHIPAEYSIQDMENIQNMLAELDVFKMEGCGVNPRLFLPSQAMLRKI